MTGNSAILSVLALGVLFYAMQPGCEADKNLTQANADLKAEIARLSVQNDRLQQELTATMEDAKAAYFKATADLEAEKKRVQSQCK